MNVSSYQRDFPAQFPQAKDGIAAQKIYEPSLKEIVIYPAEVTTSNPQRYDIRGKHIYIRNAYLPYSTVATSTNTSSSLSFYGFDAGGGVPTRPDLIRLFSGLHIYRPEGFAGFYIVHRPHGFASGTMTFSQYDRHCTPIYVLVSDDLRMQEQIGLAESTYTYGFRGVETNPATTATLQFYTSIRGARKMIDLQVDGNWATFLQVRIYADSVSGSQEIYSITPSIPFHERYEILVPMTNSISVTVNGGGSAAAGGVVYVTYMESAE